MSILPANFFVSDVKPNNIQVIDVKPNNDGFNLPTNVYTDTRTITVGQPMGLLLAITYPVTFSMQITRA